MSKDKSPATFGGIKSAMTSGDWNVPKRGPQKVVRKLGKAANKRRNKK